LKQLHLKPEYAAFFSHKTDKPYIENLMLRNNELNPSLTKEEKVFIEQKDQDYFRNDFNSVCDMVYDHTTQLTHKKLEFDEMSIDS